MSKFQVGPQASFCATAGSGDVPEKCEPAIVHDVADQHLASPAIFCIMPVQVRCVTPDAALARFKRRKKEALVRFMLRTEYEYLRRSCCVIMAVWRRHQCKSRYLCIA